MSTILGAVRCTSGSLLISDPCYLDEPGGPVFAARIDGVPVGCGVAKIEVSDQGEWGDRVASLSLEFEGGPAVKREHFDSAAVDSGQMAALDASLVSEWGGDERPGGFIDGFKPEEHAGEFNYQGTCNLTLSGFGGTIGEKLAVSQTGFGDGFYPVYVSRDSAGRVVLVEVEFIEGH